MARNVGDRQDRLCLGKERLALWLAMTCYY